METIQSSLLKHSEVPAFASELIFHGLENERIFLRPLIPVYHTGYAIGFTLPVDLPWKHWACDGRSSYSVTFSLKETLKFIDYFYSLACANEVMTVIMSSPGDKYEFVLITIKNNHSLLEDSLTKGMLEFKGWAKHVELLPA